MPESALLNRIIPLVLGGLLLSTALFMMGEFGKTFGAREKIALAYAAVMGYLLLSSVAVDVFALQSSSFRLVGPVLLGVVASFQIREWWKSRSRKR
jgi:hypothetical protein